MVAKILTLGLLFTLSAQALPGDDKLLDGILLARMKQTVASFFTTFRAQPASSRYSVESLEATHRLSVHDVSAALEKEMKGFEAELTALHEALENCGEKSPFSPARQEIQKKIDEAVKKSAPLLVRRQRVMAQLDLTLDDLERKMDQVLKDTLGTVWFSRTYEGKQEIKAPSWEGYPLKTFATHLAAARWQTADYLRRYRTGGLRGPLTFFEILEEAFLVSMGANRSGAVLQMIALDINTFRQRIKVEQVPADVSKPLASAQATKAGLVACAVAGGLGCAAAAGVAVLDGLNADSWVAHAGGLSFLAAVISGISLPSAASRVTALSAGKTKTVTRSLNDAELTAAAGSRLESIFKDTALDLTAGDHVSLFLKAYFDPSLPLPEPGCADHLKLGVNGRYL